MIWGTAEKVWEWGILKECVELEKEAGKAGREKGEEVGRGRERRGGDPLVDPVSLPREMVPGCSCVGGCHLEMACSQTPTRAWLSGGGVGPEKGGSRREAGW